MANSELKIVFVDIRKIKPYKNNPRDNKKAVDKVAKSIEKYGFKVPCVLDKNYVIVTGHTRYLAAKKLGMEKIPCIIADDLSKQKVKEFRIADNKVAEYAKWDIDKLKEELSEIKLEDLDFEEGFDFEKYSEDISLKDFFNDERVEFERKPSLEIIIKCSDQKEFEKRKKKLKEIGWIK